jgi:hypothetical protein
VVNFCVRRTEDSFQAHEHNHATKFVLIPLPNAQEVKYAPNTGILHNSVRPGLIFDVLSSEDSFQAHKHNHSRKYLLILLLNAQGAKYSQILHNAVHQFLIFMFSAVQSLGSRCGRMLWSRAGGDGHNGGASERLFGSVWVPWTGNEEEV